MLRRRMAWRTPRRQMMPQPAWEEDEEEDEEDDKANKLGDGQAPTSENPENAREGPRVSENFAKLRMNVRGCPGIFAFPKMNSVLQSKVGAWGVTRRPTRTTTRAMATALHPVPAGVAFVRLSGEGGGGGVRDTLPF